MQTAPDYFVRNPKVIIGYLNDIVKHQCLLSVTCDNECSFLTAILKIDQENNVLYFDSAQQSHINKALLNSIKAVVHAEINGISVSFKCTGIRAKDMDKRSVFVAPIPEALYRLQRREFYRVKVPMTHEKSYLQMSFMAPDGKGGYALTAKKFKVLDISISGFSFLNNDEQLQKQLTETSNANPIYLDGTLFLNDDGHSESFVSFEVKYCRSVAPKTKLNSTAVNDRVGCQFTEIISTFEMRLQRYMQRIEVNDKTKRA